MAIDQADRKKLMFLAVALIGAAIIAVVLPDRLLVREAKQAVGERLMDAESAKYQNMLLLRGRTFTATVCGEVNAKNRFGAYVGFTQFHARKLDDKWSVFMDSEESDLATRMCRDALAREGESG